MQNYKTQKKKSFWGRLINRSIIASLLTYLSVRFHYFLSDSFVARIFYISDGAEGLRKSGLFGSLYSKIDKSPVFPTVRRTFAKNVESSRFVAAYRAFVHKAVTSSVRTTGVFVLSGGLYALLGYIMNWIQSGPDFRTYYELVIIAAMIICGSLMLFSQRSNGRKLHESRFMSAFLFDFLGLNPLSVDKDTKSENHFLAAFLGGIVFGVISFVTSVGTALAVLAAIVVVMLVVYSPESGLLLSMMLIPIFETETVAYLLVVTLVSFFFKLLRGKRNLTFKAEDIASLFAALAFVIFFPVGSKLLVSLMITVYFMASNLMRSMEYLKKSVNSLSFGLSLNVIANAVSGGMSVFGITTGLLSGFDPGKIVVSGEYTAILALIFSLYMLFEKDCVFHFVYRLLFVVCSLASVFMTMSETVWLIALISVFVYFVYRTLRFFNVTFVYLLLAPVFYFIYTFASYKFDILPFSLCGSASCGDSGIRALLFGSGMLGDGMMFTFFSAFGVFGCLLIAFMLYMLLSRAICSSRYSRNGAREFCALIVASLCAFTVCGTHSAFDTQLLTFWTFCGLISATGNVVTSVSPEDEYY